MADLLSQLKQHSVVVADSGDFGSIRKYQPRDATTNPSLILKAATMPEYAELVDRVVREARAEASSASATLSLAMDKLAVAFGLEILKIVPNRVSAEGSKLATIRLAASEKTAIKEHAFSVVGSFTAGDRIWHQRTQKVTLQVTAPEKEPAAQPVAPTTAAAK